MKQQEFIKLVNPFKDKLFRIAKRMLISKEEAEDAIQEVLMRLWKKRESLTHYNNVEALSVTITKNYCLDQLKSKRASNLQLVHSNYKESSATIDREIEGKENWHWVEKIINELPEQQRLIIQMRDIEQMEFNEIATILNMNETAIRVALSRARKIIRDKITAIHNYGTGKS
ncbi:RNA polymerase sigma factor [Flavobacterium sp.]|uniref:RNA polymerase sigma factor n=1 Tax=Flavobacterium sp. TaxID=239 RepID=UPI003527910F